MAKRTLGVAVLGALLLACAGEGVARAEGTSAEAHFFAGQKLYTDKAYDAALVELRASYAAAPSPNSRLYIARALRGLGKTAEAYDEYTAAILDAADRNDADGKYDATELAASTERTAIRPGAAAPVVDAAEAEARFRRGQQLYADKKCQDALVELRASHAAAPSPNSRLYIARCLRDTGATAKAYDEYAQVILDAADRVAQADKYAETQKAASRERVALRERIATVVLTVPAGVAGTRVFVGAEELPAERWASEVHLVAGPVTVRAEAPGRAPFSQSITLAAGAAERVTVELAPAPVVTRAPASGLGPMRPIAYATAGVGVVGFILWGALGEKASSRYDGLLQQCVGRCGSGLQSDVDAGRRETAASEAGLAIGIIGIAAGATLWTVDYVLGRRAPPASAVTASFVGGRASARAAW
jgi:hypothetical protein